jgi:hypothetical protein
MDSIRLLTALISSGCRLIPNGETLRVQDPHRALTDDLRQAIRQHKAVLLTILASRDCRHCGHAGPPDVNWPEMLCTHCDEPLATIHPDGTVEPYGNVFPLAQEERAVIYEYDGGRPRAVAEALAAHGAVVGLPACPQCNGMAYQYEDGYVDCTTPGCPVCRPGGGK